MKVRNGFVSNSSSSSFVIDIVNDETRFARRFTGASRDEEAYSLVSKEQQKALLDLGFRYSFISHTSLVEMSMREAVKDNIFKRKDKSITFPYPNMILYWPINQHEIVEPLIRLGVPFKMLTDYGSMLHIWKPWKRNFLSFYNTGEAYEMGYLRGYDEKDKSISVVPITFTSTEMYLWENYDEIYKDTVETVNSVFGKDWR